MEVLALVVGVVGMCFGLLGAIALARVVVLEDRLRAAGAI